jgi:hypothetical protein
MGCFSQTPISEALLSSSPNSIRDLAIMDGQEWFTRSVDSLIYSVRTGASAFDHIFGMDWVEYFRNHPEIGAGFNAAMAAATVQLEGPVLDRYDFSWADIIADVAGGTGSFLASVLERNPQAHGILGELEEVTKAARQALAEARVSDRCEVITIDMFTRIPFSANACILKRVIHDWSDEEAIKILANCRDVVAPAGRVVVIEPVVIGLTSALSDVVMMTLGGRERTNRDFERLFSASGLKVSRLVAATPAVSVVEGKVA